MNYRCIFSILLLMSAGARAALFTFDSGSLNLAIPDGNPNGVSWKLAIASLPAEIADVNLVFTVSGGASGDLYGYLSHENGGFAVLLNRPGKTDDNPLGYGDAGFTNVRLSDQASTDVHLYGGNSGNALSGNWQPDGRNVDPLLVSDLTARSALLDSFNTRNPNGTWTLFFSDMAGGEQSTLVSWGLEIEAVPEPVNVALALFASGAVCTALWCRRRLRNG